MQEKFNAYELINLHRRYIELANAFNATHSDKGHLPLKLKGLHSSRNQKQHRLSERRRLKYLIRSLEKSSSRKTVKKLNGELVHGKCSYWLDIDIPKKWNVETSGVENKKSCASKNWMYDEKLREKKPRLRELEDSEFIQIAVLEERYMKLHRIITRRLSGYEPIPFRDGTILENLRLEIRRLRWISSRMKKLPVGMVIEELKERKFPWISEEMGQWDTFLETGT